MVARKRCDGLESLTARDDTCPAKPTPVVHIRVGLVVLVPSRALGFLLVVVAALRRHVCVVVRLCAKPQVSNLTTGWVITRVQDVFSLGDRTIGELPGEAMGANYLTVDPDRTVARWLLPAGPLQATIGAPYKPAGKPFGWRCVGAGHYTPTQSVGHTLLAVVTVLMASLPHAYER